jgi:hypothetical protein
MMSSAAFDASPQGPLRITAFTQDTALALSTAIAKALQAVAAEHGLLLTLPAGKYTGQAFHQTLQFTIARPTTPPSDARALFPLHARRYGLNPSDLDRAFEHNNVRYTLAGINPASREYPILATRHDGHPCKFQPDTVLTALGRIITLDPTEPRGDP